MVVLRAQYSKPPPKRCAMVSERAAIPRMKHVRSVDIQVVRRSLLVSNRGSIKPSHKHPATATGPILSTKRFHPEFVVS